MSSARTGLEDRWSRKCRSVNIRCYRQERRSNKEHIPDTASLHSPTDDHHGAPCVREDRLVIFENWRNGHCSWLQRSWNFEAWRSIDDRSIIIKGRIAGKRRDGWLSWLASCSRTLEGNGIWILKALYSNYISEVQLENDTEGIIFCNSGSIGWIRSDIRAPSCSRSSRKFKHIQQMTNADAYMRLGERAGRNFGYMAHKNTSIKWILFEFAFIQATLEKAGAKPSTYTHNVLWMLHVHIFSISLSEISFSDIGALKLKCAPTQTKLLLKEHDSL